MTIGNETKLYEGRILAALSGGADSVALLCLLHGEGCDVEALHCNFHLRGAESDRDEEFVRHLCQRLGIQLHVRHFDTIAHAREKGISTEMAARELRYQWFEEMRRQRNATYIAVAHHQDDQAETVLLNLIRGTGLRGLAGMRERNGHIVRPLIGYSKADILSYLSSIGQDYVTDSTNLERDALRNRIRLDILPLLRDINPQATEHIAQAARHVAEAIPYYIKGVDASGNELTATTLHERLQGMGFTPTQEEQMLRSRRTGAVFESATHHVTWDRGRLVVEEKEKDDAPPLLLTTLTDATDAMAWLRTQPLSPQIAYLDAQRITRPLCLRHPQKGDRFQPYGMKKGSRLVSDFLSDLKLTRFEKERQWLVCMNGEIVWVANRRIADPFRITPQTRQVLTLRLQ